MVLAQTSGEATSGADEQKSACGKVFFTWKVIYDHSLQLEFQWGLHQHLGIVLVPDIGREVMAAQYSTYVLRLIINWL